MFYRRIANTLRNFPVASLCTAAAVFLVCACATQNASQATGLRMYVLDCGSIDVLDISVFQPGIGKGKHKTLVDSCYLIVHPKGTLIWDTGLSDTLAGQPQGKTINNTFVMRVKNPLAAQLQAIGYTSANINFMGISHMHGDHIGNVGLFPKATLLMQQEEYAAAFGVDHAKFGNDPANYPTLSANPVQQLRGDLDVFGDGSVTIKRAIGHTPGHQALYIKLPQTGNILLSGDIVHYRANWDNLRVPSFNFDREQSIKTMKEYKQFLKDNDAKLWIQHDKEQNAIIKHAPAYYQ